MPRLLVVEDEPDIALILRTKFSRAGFEVQIASDGTAGLEAATTTQPDIVLLDAMLPKLDGYAVCRAVKAHYAASGERAPLIAMLSARSQAADRQRGVEAGCDDYILKPFRPAELLARVQQLLNERGDP
jgi:DNA-binding response OmpR family regulator